MNQYHDWPLRHEADIHAAITARFPDVNAERSRYIMWQSIGYVALDENGKYTLRKIEDDYRELQSSETALIVVEMAERFLPH